MAKTVNALGRNWSHHQMHGLLTALVDRGWSVGFFRDVYTDGTYPDVPVPVISDTVFFEMYHMGGKYPNTYRKDGPTMWKAICAAIESCPFVRDNEGGKG